MGKYIPNDGNKYVYKYVSPMNSFIDVTGNLIDVTETSQWGLIANKTEDRTCYYKRIWGGEVNLQGYDVLGFSGRFRTWLPEYRDLISGEYGVQIDILGSRPTTGEENQQFYYTFYFSNKDMYGDPYNFDAFYLQEKTFDISGISKIDVISIGFYQDADFRTETSFIPVADSDNLFIESPMLAVGYSTDRFKTDEVIIYTDNPLTYLSQLDIGLDDAEAAQAALDEANKRLLQLRWMHLLGEEEAGTYNLSTNGISTTKAICIDKIEELPESAAIKWYKYNKPKVEEKEKKKYSAAAGEFWDDISFTNSDLDMMVIPNNKEPKEQYKAIVEYPGEEYTKEQTEIELNKTDGLYDERRALFNFTNEQLNLLYYKELAINNDFEQIQNLQSNLIAAHEIFIATSSSDEQYTEILLNWTNVLQQFNNVYQRSDEEVSFITNKQVEIFNNLFEEYNLDNRQSDDNLAGLILIIYKLIQNPAASLYINDVLGAISYIKESINFDTEEELNRQIEQTILPNSLLISHLQALRLFIPSTVSRFFSNIWNVTSGVQVSASTYATSFANALKDFNDAYAGGTLISSASIEEAALLTEIQNVITKLQSLDTEIARYRSTELGKVNYYTSNIITFENEDPDADLNKVKEMLAELRVDVDVDGFQGVYNCYGESGEILNENESKVSRLLEAKIVKGETVTDAVGPDDYITWEFPLINSMIERPIDTLEYITYEAAIDATEENFKNGDYYYLNEENQWTHIVPTDEVEFQTTLNFYYKRNNVSVDDSLPDVFSITRKGDSKQYFRIRQMYSSNYTNNVIKCYVKKADGSEFTTTINLSFGEKGNSGTDYTFYLEFEDKTKFALQATGFTPEEIEENKHKIKIVPRLFNYNGREITNEISSFDFTKNCDPLNEITMTNHQGKYIEIYSNKAGTEEWDPVKFANTIIEATCTLNMTLPVLEDKQFLQVEEIPHISSDDEQIPACQKVEHTLINKPISNEVSITLSTALPIPIIKDNKTVVAFNGNSSITYSSSGTDPIYYKDQFTIYTQSENRLEYVPNQHWKIYNIDAEGTDLYYPIIDAERRMTVPGMYLMGGENISLFADVDRPGEEENSIVTTTEFILPLRIFMRVYDSKLLNSWDGSLTLDSQNGIILSTLMGAGYKDEHNTFNGVLMGSTGVAYDEEKTAPNEEDTFYSGLGLYGYSEGQKSFGFNINGRAFIGRANTGQIKFDGNSGAIKSGNWKGSISISKDEETGELTDFTVSDGNKGSFFDLDDGIIITNNFIFNSGYIGGDSQANGAWKLTNGKIEAKQDNKYMGLGTSGHTSYAFYAGATDSGGSGAVFSVDHTGKASMSNATISGGKLTLSGSGSIFQFVAPPVEDGYTEFRGFTGVSSPQWKTMTSSTNTIIENGKISFNNSTGTIVATNHGGIIIDAASFVTIRARQQYSAAVALPGVSSYEVRVNIAGAILGGLVIDGGCAIGGSLYVSGDILAYGGRGSAKTRLRAISFECPDTDDNDTVIDTRLTSFVGDSSGNTYWGVYCNYYGTDFRAHGKWLCRIDQNGNGHFASTSDVRYKDIIGIISEKETLNLLKNIDIVNFYYKGGKDITTGIKAQQLRDILLKYNIGYRTYLNIEDKTSDEEGNFYNDLNTPEENIVYSIEYDKLVPIVWRGWQIHHKTIQELQNNITLLQQEIQSLKGENIKL